ncbi:molybdenum-pterin binding domain-containing protein [Rhodoblastus acidophilus]|uniref:Molybdenum-pterin binding domain-containing protein n=1 Tax=Rhodoblastus acidophilus TaxID=1074 RepID=A0A212RP89_RHOAC|nr:TOBE domain-containing protein [Rhodoblastus acidophilus]PPQ36727.1 transporter [Rhodoblastus acidophilus]RAI21476.1 transporter [Rhodoblastus acidophilus]SNB74380.1 molybdenum-pterin binding domain-containing protein [Rhodoblastus acidophilus]
MKISARNVFPGKIIEIKKGATTAHVQLNVNGLIVTAAITNEAVEELGLKVGGEASAVVKSSDVMVMVG